MERNDRFNVDETLDAQNETTTNDDTLDEQNETNANDETLDEQNETNANDETLDAQNETNANDETLDEQNDPTPNDETNANGETDAARRPSNTTRNDDLTDEDFEDWEDDYETFAEKLKKIPAFFSWNGKTTVRGFAVATGGLFGAALLSNLFIACSAYADLNQIADDLLALLGIASGFCACLTFLLVSVRRYRDAGLFAWGGKTTRKEFFLAALQNVGKTLAWSAPFFLVLVAGEVIYHNVNFDEDQFFPFFPFVAVFSSAFALFIFGLLGATLAITQAATRYLRSANSFSWLGRATRKEFSFALGDYCVATVATAIPFAFASLIWAFAFDVIFREDELVSLALLAFVFYFVVASLIFSPVLFAASVRRLRELGLNPWATLLYLVVPAPYMALILIALDPAPLDKETPSDDESKETPSDDESKKTPSADEDEATPSQTEENADA